MPSFIDGEGGEVFLYGKCGGGLRERCGGGPLLGWDVDKVASLALDAAH